MTIKNRIYQAWQTNPLQVILLLALITRLVAVIFSRGFGMHDDHFLVIEPAQAWADGINYQNWLPGGRTDALPDGHSLLYSGLHYLLFSFFNYIHLGDPQIKMLIVRLIHGLFSLLIVLFGYRITLRISGQKEASLAGIILALCWFMPMLNVRNLVEVVCIPFMLAGVWLIIREERSHPKGWDYLLAGIVMGLGFSIRFQTAIFIGGLGLAMLIKAQWKPAVVFTLGLLAAVLPVQGLIDYFIWGRPFAEFGEYVRYNIEAANDYITGPWYNFILLISGILIPPVSLFLLAGFFKLWKKQLIIWLPAFLFLLFHSVFPNKQERFIFPVLPFIIILGVAGWGQIVSSSAFWQNKQRFLKGSWIFFWVLNTLLLIFVTVSYSKKSRVEVMTYLSRYKDIHVILLEDSNHSSAKMMPQFYLGQWVEVISKTDKGFSWYSPLPVIDSSNIIQSRFVLFFEDTNLENRVKDIKKELPSLEYETTVKPGFIDDVMYRLNPVNLNQTIFVYRNKALVPDKITE